MTIEANDKNVTESKRAKSDALSQGLWKALWVAIAVCILWLAIEGGFRLYHRPALLDARVAQLESKIVTVEAHEAQLEASLKGSLEAEKTLAPVAGRLLDMINQVGLLPMTALPAPVSQAVVLESQPETIVKRIFKHIQLLGDKLVRVQVVGDVKDVALTPAAQDIVRQQLKLHLVSARMAWLSNMPHVCKDDLQQAQNLLAKHFQAQSSSVVAVQKNLTDLHAEVSKATQMKKGQ